MRRRKERNHGITLIALIVVIIIILILAGVTIRVVFAKNGLIERTKWSIFGNEMKRVEEAVKIGRSSNDIDANVKGTPIDTTISNDGVFIALYDSDRVTDKLKRDIVELRENNRNSGLAQDAINERYEALKNSDGNIEDLLYINKNVAGGKDRTYLYDAQTDTVIKVPGKTIFGEEYHIFEWGTEEKIKTGNITVPKPAVPDLSNHKGLEEGWIPIYTVENYKKIASEEQNYTITDLHGKEIGKYNMNKDAKYRMMNDIDFQDKELDTIKGFKGTFDGNGYYIKDIHIDTTNSVEQYYSYGKSEEKIGAPSGLFDRIELGKVENLGVDNANIIGIASVGILTGEAVGTNVDNCIIKNSFATSNGQSYMGSSGGLIGWVYKDETQTQISTVLVDNTEVKGKSITSGLVAYSLGDIHIKGCTIENSKINKENYNAESQGGILGYSYPFPDSGNNVMIENCYVGKTIFSSLQNEENQTSCGGIFGGSYGENTIEIIDCGIEDIELSEGQNNGGICATLNNATNLTISGCCVNNMKTMGNVDGGILGSMWSDGGATIRNCKVSGMRTKEKNSYYQINKGGIAGFVNSAQSLQVSDCDVSNSEIIARKTYVSNSYNSVSTAGIIGGQYLTDNESSCSIENCNVNNTIVKTIIDGVIDDKQASNNLMASGIIGYSHTPNIDNCQIDNSHILLEITGKYIGPYYETEITGGKAIGICGSAHLGTKNANITNCKISDTEIKSNFGGAVGIIEDGSWANNTTKIDGIDINNCIIKGKGSSMGVIHTTKSVLVENVNIKHTDIISEQMHAAGISTFLLGSSTIQNCTIENCNIKNLNVAKFSGAPTYDYGSVGGIVGTYSGNSITISQCNIIDTSLDNATDNTGGIIACSPGGSILKGNIVKNIKINAMGKSNGAIIGTHTGNTQIYNCDVEGGTIYSKDSNVGGIIGWGISNNIQESNVRKIEINAENGKVGGLIGCDSRGDGIVNNCDVEDIKIFSKGPLTGGLIGCCTNENIENCNLITSNIKSDSYAVGGIVGNYRNNGANINLCTVVSSEITGTYKSVGGIVGEYSDNGDPSTGIMNCTVKTSKIGISGTDAKALGGIVGNASNISYINTLNNNRTEEGKSRINGCNVLGTQISGVDYVGGISGTAATNVNNCFVGKNENQQTQIKGRNCVGGIQGFGGILGEKPTLEYQYTDYYNKQKSVINPIENYYYSTLSDCSVKDTIISGNQDVNYIQGKNSYYLETWTKEKGNDIITNCIEENVELVH